MPTQRRPLPQGTLCIARLSNGLAMRSACAEHIFKLGRAFRVRYGSGWAQAAKCMVCNDVTSPMDIEWFERAEAEDVVRCVAMMKAERLRLSRAIVRLQIVGASVE